MNSISTATSLIEVLGFNVQTFPSPKDIEEISTFPLSPPELEVVLTDKPVSKSEEHPLYYILYVFV